MAIHNIYAPISDAHALLISRLAQDKAIKNHHTLVIVQDYQQGKNLQQNLKFFLPPDQEALFMGEPVSNCYNIDAPSPMECMQQYYKLHAIQKSRVQFVIATVNTAMKRLISPSLLQNQCLKITRKEKLHYSELINKLVKMGYAKTHTVKDFGEFSTHGDIIEIHSIDENISYRCEINEDIVDDIQAIDTTQRDIKAASLAQVMIYPCAPLFLGQTNDKDLEQNSIAYIGKDFLNSSTYQLLQEEQYPRNAHHYLPIAHIELSNLFEYCKNCIAICSDTYQADIVKHEKQLYADFAQAKKIHGNIFPSPDRLYLTRNEFHDKLYKIDAYLLSQYKDKALALCGN